MIDRVLVLGGTGKTGRLVARKLEACGVDARIATRNPIAAKQVRFDWDDVSSHGAALDGVGSVYLVAPTDRAEHLAIMRPLLERAVERGTARLVLLSASSLDEGGPMMGAVHAWLRMNAPRWTVLRPSWFMQNFVTQHLCSIVEKGCIYSAAKAGRVPFIDADDIAAVAVKALVDSTLPSGALLLTGPEAMTYDEAALLISKVADRPVLHCRLSVDELALRYTTLGIPRPYANTLARMDEAISHGTEDRTTDEVQRLTGRMPSKLSDFLAAHRSAYEP